MHGALAAVFGLQRRSLPPVMHLREINPYVSSALQEWKIKHGVDPTAMRQPGALPAGSDALAGCSSFGMSGTNAHGLFAGPPSAGWERDTAAPLAWQRAARMSVLGPEAWQAHGKRAPVH